jgi:hypothetical protein
MEYKEEVTKYLKEYIEAEKDLRLCPESWSSAPKRSAMYNAARSRFTRASKNLWHITDCEYGEDGIRDKVWEWRYCSVMARKCCWHQLSSGNTDEASKLMRALHKAEIELVTACGLMDIYQSPQQAIEKQFPNLCSSQPANTTTTTGGSWWTAVKNWLDTIAIMFSFGPPY